MIVFLSLFHINNIIFEEDIALYTVVDQSMMVHSGFYMCLVFPKLIPLWLAPLLEPYCKEMIP